MGKPNSSVLEVFQLYGSPIGEVIPTTIPLFAETLLVGRVPLVDDHEHGLYLLVRDVTQVEFLRESIAGEYSWKSVVYKPVDLDLYMHYLLSLDSLTYQDLYHFKIGNPLEDVRLRTFPAASINFNTPQKRKSSSIIVSLRYRYQ